MREDRPDHIPILKRPFQMAAGLALVAVAIGGFFVFTKQRVPTAHAPTVEASPPPARQPVDSFPAPELLPTPILATSCMQAVCFWEQIFSAENVRVSGQETLRRFHFRSTEVDYPDGPNGPEYSDNFVDGPNIRWYDAFGYTLCSKSRPTDFSRSGDEKAWRVTPLDVVSPYGYQRDAVVEYWIVCHNAMPDSAIADHPGKLGYQDDDAWGKQSQYTIADPQDFPVNRQQGSNLPESQIAFLSLVNEAREAFLKAGNARERSAIKSSYLSRCNDLIGNDRLLKRWIGRFNSGDDYIYVDIGDSKYSGTREVNIILDSEYSYRDPDDPPAIRTHYTRELNEKITHLNEGDRIIFSGQAESLNQRKNGSSHINIYCDLFDDSSDTAFPDGELVIYLDDLTVTRG